MSDGSPGEGWWQASDGQWYPPDQHPQFQAGGTPESPPPTTAMPSTPAPPPTAAMPPVGPPPGPPPGAPTGPPPGAPGAGSNNARWIIVGVLAVVVVVIAAFLLLGGDSKKNNAASTNGSSGSSSSSSSSSSRSSSSSSKSSSSSSSEQTAADLQKLMLKASDISPQFKDATFTPDNTSPAPCGQPNTATEFPPVLDVGSTAANSDGTLIFQEEVTTYADESTAQQAFSAGLQGLSCTQGTTSNGDQITISQPKDVSTDLGVPGAIEIDIQSSTVTGQVFAATNGNGIAVFQFQGATNADTTGVPNPLSIAKKGFQKLGS